MKAPSLLSALILISVFLLPGCFVTTYEYDSSPAVSRLEGGAFSAHFSPEKGDAAYFSWFKLVLENRGESPIAIDWNKTRYLLDGKNMGAFVWGGIDPASLRDNAVPEDEILPGQTFSRQISPQAKVAMASRGDYDAARKKSGLYSGMLPAGENSILLTLKIGDRVVRKKMSVTITEQKKIVRQADTKD